MVYLPLYSKTELTLASQLDPYYLVGRWMWVWWLLMQSKTG